MKILKTLRRAKELIINWAKSSRDHDRQLELIGSMCARNIASLENVTSLHDAEFRVFSQWGDDGIIQWLISKLPDLPKRFVEFGVEDYKESNTRFLLINDNWEGLIMDGSKKNIDRIKKSNLYWRHDLTAINLFLTRDNVDATIAEWADTRGIGILHIDVDGNDYWLWEAIVSTSATIVIVEYNSLFGLSRTISVPYKTNFIRHREHYSGLYFSASLPALAHLGKKKGYALIGTNSAGNNAYFLKEESVSSLVPEITVEAAYSYSKFRDSRDSSGNLTFCSGVNRLEMIRGVPVVDVISGIHEKF